MTRWISLLLLFLIAGPSWAGDAWIAEYRIADTNGPRSLTVIQDDRRIEYRMSDEPVRVWRKLADGMEMRELYLQDRRIIVSAPGDLRAMEYSPDWVHLSGVIDPAIRTRLGQKGSGVAFDQSMVRYRGADVQGRPVELDWLPEAGIPLRYRDGEKKDALILQSLTRMPAEQAFSTTAGLLEIDEADLSDMELDPFVRRLPRSAHAAAH